MSQDNRPIVTTEEAITLLGVSKATVIRMIQRGELQAYKLTLGQTSPYRIYKDSIDSVIERRQQPFKKP
jgi:excisionase family DNA binding protein